MMQILGTNGRLTNKAGKGKVVAKGQWACQSWQHNTSAWYGEYLGIMEGQPTVALHFTFADWIAHIFRVVDTSTLDH